MNRINLAEPYIHGNEWQYVKRCLDSGWVSPAGRFVDEFEKEMAARLGSRHAVSCVNGTAALHTALLVSGIGPRDGVIVPTITFIAPVNAIRYTGADPVFMDCDDYLNMDAEKTADYIKKECRFRNGRLYDRRTKNRIRAILPVHVFGNPVDIEPLMDLAEEYDLKVIEDAAESLGSYYKAGRYKGKETGAIGDAGCLSFNGNKIITSGGGGMVVTDDRLLADKIRRLTTQAKDDPVRYIHNTVGYNYRLSNIQAALGLAQLERLDAFIRIKRRNFKLYDGYISNIDGLGLLKEPPYGFSNMWFYSLIVEKRRYGMDNMGLMRALAKEGIGSRPVWHLNHRQRPYLKSRSYRIEKAPLFYKKALNIPCGVELSEKEIKRVIKVIKKNAKR